MIRLMKAEWFRVRHSYHFLRWAVFIWCCLAVIPVLSDVDVLESPLSLYLAQLGELNIMFIPLFVGGWISVCIGMNFQNKTACYERMDGHSVLESLLGRMVVYTALMSLGVCALLGISCAGISAVNGTGGVEQIPVRVLLFVVVMIHICLNGVLMTVLMRGLAGIGMVFLRFEVFEGVFSIVIPELLVTFDSITKETGTHVMDWFVTSQLGTIFSGKITGHLATAVAGSMLIECGLWFVAAYGRLKKGI